MRLDCPKCGAKGDNRRTKTPMWRCSPAPGNGGCGYEWDDPTYNDPTIDYKSWNREDQHEADCVREMGGGAEGQYWWSVGYRSMSDVEEAKRRRKLETTERRRLLIEEEELRRLGEPLRCPKCGLTKVIDAPSGVNLGVARVWKCDIEPDRYGNRGCGHQWAKSSDMQETSGNGSNYYWAEGHWRRRPNLEAPEPTQNAGSGGSKGTDWESIGTPIIFILVLAVFLFFVITNTDCSSDDPRPPDRPADSYPRG
jgi:ribosomal protein L37AE/L43A